LSLDKVTACEASSIVGRPRADDEAHQSATRQQQATNIPGMMRFNVFEALHACLQCQGLAISSIAPLLVESKMQQLSQTRWPTVSKRIAMRQMRQHYRPIGNGAPGRLRYTAARCLRLRPAAASYRGRGNHQRGGRNSVKIL